MTRSVEELRQESERVESLKAAARENPVGAGLIAGGALWLLIGNERLKAAVSSAATAASSTIDQGTHTLRAAGSLKTTSAPPTAPEMDHEGHSGSGQTFPQAKSSASSAASGAAEAISDAAGSIKDRFDEGIAYAQENFNKIGNSLPERHTLGWRAHRCRTSSNDSRMWSAR